MSSQLVDRLVGLGDMFLVMFHGDSSRISITTVVIICLSRILRLQGRLPRHSLEKKIIKCVILGSVRTYSENEFANQKAAVI
jgi:hypothetical protein